MRSTRLPARIAGLLLLFSALSAPAQDTPRSIVERAIAAHGGAERLSRLRADKTVIQGKIVLAAKEGLTTFTTEQTLQLPGRFKQVAKVSISPDKTITIAQVIDGDKVMMTIDGQPREVTPSGLIDLRLGLDLQRAARLVPLLTDSAYHLTALNEEKVNNRPAFGVKVSSKGRRDVRLYFDHETGLLVKTEHTRDDGSGKEVLQEEFYGDFKDFGGFRRWTRIAVFREGKKIMEAEVRDVKYFDKIDDAEFKP
jgi:hypothetical protein